MAVSEHDSRNDDVLEEEFSDYEKVYLRMSRAFAHVGKEHWGIHCVCKIRCEGLMEVNLSARMRNAWMQLAIEYPGLCMIPDGMHKQWSTMDETSLVHFVDDTFFDACNFTADEIVAAAKPRTLPALYNLARSSEVVFLTQHWRCDGLGSCMLLDRLMEIMAAPTPPTDLSDNRQQCLLSPNMESAAGAMIAPDPELQAYAKEYVERFHMKAVNGLGLPYQGDAQTLPSRSAHRETVFATDETCAILTACKSLQITVTAAIHAALAHTVFSYLPKEECQAGYTTVMAVNMRSHLPAPYDTQAHACQTYVAGIIPTVSYNSSFIDAARSLAHEYRSWWSEKFMRSLRWIYKYNLAALTAPRAADAAPPKPPSGVTLSSLGVVERHLRGEYGAHLKVVDFRFGVSMMTRQMILYAWTFKGKLTLSLNYNEAYYTDAMAQEVLLRIVANLEKGLGLATGQMQVL